jgi:phage-related minor tail protein
MADLSVTGEVVVTSEKAEAAFDRVGDKATQMANEVAASAGKAGQAVDKIGDGAGASAEKFTRAESRMRDAIKRSTQELQLLGKTASEKLEFNINAKGLDASKFAPYIEELKKAEAAQRIATGGLDKMGISAAQTAAALRGVPAQFTDIITSLQGGQAPLTVFLQQGGQLKDMFGGAGAAARALGGYVAGLINPFTLAAAGAAALAVAYNQGSKEADAYRTALVTTGNVAGTTAGQLKSYAQEISGVVGTQGKAAESLAAFVSTGRVSRDVLKEASQAAIAWERATGQAVGATAKQFADLGKDPLQAVLKLNEGTNFLTESVYRQIKSLDEQGRTAEAAAVAQRAYADALTGRAGEIERNLGSIETAWNKVKDAAKGGWDAILNVGRAETTQDRLAATRKQIADLENRLASGGGFGSTAGGAATGRPDAANNARLQAQLLGLQAQAAALEGVAFAAKTAAEAEAERAKQMQATAAWDKEGAKYLTDKAKLERDLTAARNEGLAAGKSQAEIEQRLAQIRESYAKKGGSSAASENKELRERQRIYAELVGVSSTYYNDLAAAQSERAKGNLSEAEYVKYVETLIQKQPFAVAQEKARAEAIKESAKAASESAKALGAWYEVREKESQGLQNQINARREEVSMMGMSTEAVVAYTQAKYEQQAAEKEAYAAALESASFYAGEYAEAYKTAAEAARQQAAQLRELGGLEVEKANKDAAKKATDEWERAAADIERALTDSLLRGFESGKDFAENLRDSLKNMFSTLVLRPVISAALSPVAGAVNGFVGNAVGGAAAGSGIGSGIATSIGTSAIGSAFSLGLTNFGTGLGSTLANGIFGGIGTNISNFGTLAGAGNLSGALGVAAPYLAGIGALYAIIKGLDDSGTYHTGGAAQYSGARGLRTSLGFRDNEEGLPSYNPNDNIDNQFGTGFGYVERGDQAISAVSAIAQGLGTALDGIAVAFGQTAGYEIATAFADDSSGDGAWGALRISKDGQDLLNWQDTRTSRWAPKEFSDGEAGYKEYLAAVAKDTRQVLLDMDLPSWADDMLESIGDSASMEQLAGVLTQIGVVQSAFVALGKSMEMFADLTDEMQAGLLDAAGSIEALTAGAGAFYQGFYSEQERVDAAVAQLNETLDGLDLSIDPRMGDDAKDQFRAAVEAAFAAGDAELAAALLAISGNFASAADYFAQLSDAAAQAAKQALDAARGDALNNLRRAVDRDRTALQDQASTLQDTISGISSAVDMLRSNAADLYGTVQSTAQQLAAQGMVYVEQALAGVQAGGSVLDYTGLESAIGAARGGIASGTYASQFERERDAMVLAGQLSQLGDLGDLQLSIEERQLNAINSQIEYLDGLAKTAQDLVDGTAELTGTVNSYFQQLLELMKEPEQATTKPLAATTPASGFSSGSDGGGGGSGGFDRLSEIKDYYNQTLDPDALRMQMWLRGWTLEDMAAAADVTTDFAREYLKLPKFAVGTNYVPRDMPAIVHEGEAIVPKAFNPWANGGGSVGGGNSELIAEVRALRVEVAALRASGQAIAENTSGTPQMVRQFDQVTQGGNAIRNKALA